MIKNKKNPLIQICNLSHSFEGRLIFENLSFSISKWDICLITGPSGVGKTTLLSLVWGIVPPQSGTVTYDPILIPRERAIWYALIDGPFFELLSARDNIYLLESFAGVRIDTDYYRELIEYFEIRELVDMKMISLSAWQRERVNFVRALIHRPRLLILDEPWANLDTHLFMKMISYIEQEVRDSDMACIIVSHDERFIPLSTEHIILTPR